MEPGGQPADTRPRMRVTFVGVPESAPEEDVVEEGADVRS